MFEVIGVEKSNVCQSRVHSLNLYPSLVVVIAVTVAHDLTVTTISTPGSTAHPLRSNVIVTQDSTVQLTFS